MLKRTLDRIISIADQNDDGSLDFKDVSVIAESIGSAAKNAAVSAISSAEEKSRELEKKILQPIFVEDLDSADFLVSKLVRITEIDKKRAESEVCRGSIGYISDQKDLRSVFWKKEACRYQNNGY